MIRLACTADSDASTRLANQPTEAVSEPSNGESEVR
jgi:hypothetical protein